MALLLLGFLMVGCTNDPSQPIEEESVATETEVFLQDIETSEMVEQDTADTNENVIIEAEDFDEQQQKLNDSCMLFIHKFLQQKELDDLSIENYTEEEIEECKEYEMNIVLDTLQIKYFKAPHRYTDEYLQENEGDEALGDFSEEKLKSYTDENYFIIVEYAKGYYYTMRDKLPQVFALVHIQQDGVEIATKCFMFRRGLDNYMTIEQTYGFDGEAQMPENFEDNLQNEEYVESNIGFIFANWELENREYYIFGINNARNKGNRDMLLITCEEQEGEVSIDNIQYGLMY